MISTFPSIVISSIFMKRFIKIQSSRVTRFCSSLPSFFKI